MATHMKEHVGLINTCAQEEEMDESETKAECLWGVVSSHHRVQMFKGRRSSFSSSFLAFFMFFNPSFLLFLPPVILAIFYLASSNISMSSTQIHTVLLSPFLILSVLLS